MTDDSQDLQNNLVRRVEELAILSEISRTISTTQDLDEMVQYLANHLAKLVDATGAFIVLWDETTNTSIPAAAYGMYHHQYVGLKSQDAEPTLTARVVETALPVLVPDVTRSPYISARISAHFPDKSLLGVPLIVKGQAIGAAIIGEARYQRVFNEHEIQLAMSAGGQIAAAIMNARLFTRLSREHMRLNETLNAVADGILVADASGRIQYANPAYHAITGLDPQEIYGRQLWELILDGADDGDFIKRDVSATLEKGQAWRHEMVGHRGDGSTYDAEMIISIIHSTDGRQAGYVASLRDITSLKELDRMKNRFVSTVSHELRTPLSVISLYTENLLDFYDRIEDSQRKDLLGEIHQEAITLHKLIEDLLSLSRLDAGKAEPRCTYFDLCELLQEIVDRQAKPAQSKGVEVSVIMHHNPLQVYADRDQIGQVLRNLLSNAIKFIPGSGLVSVSADMQAGRAVVQVSDTGIGIAPADMHHLFERFYRSKQAILQEIPGTGLGLAISREILQRHNGSIEAESQLGSGTTFRVSVPLAAARQPTLLVVSDDPFITSTFKIFLEPEYHAILVDDVQPALEQLREFSCSLVILGGGLAEDVPGGLQEHLRAGLRWQRLPILLVAEDKAQQARLEHLAGEHAVLTRQVTRDELIKSVDRLIHQDKTW